MAAQGRKLSVTSVTTLTGLTIGSANTLTSAIVAGAPNGSRIVIAFRAAGGTRTYGQGSSFSVSMPAPWEDLGTSIQLVSSTDLFYTGVTVMTARKQPGLFPTTATLWSSTLNAPFVMGDATQNAYYTATPIFEAVVITISPSYGYGTRRVLYQTTTSGSSFDAPNTWRLNQGGAPPNSPVPGNNSGIYVQVDAIEPRTIPGAPFFGQDTRTGVAAANGFSKDYEDSTWCVSSQSFSASGSTDPLIHTINRNSNALQAFRGHISGLTLAFDVADPRLSRRRGLGMIRG